MTLSRRMFVSVLLGTAAVPIAAQVPCPAPSGDGVIALGSTITLDVLTLEKKCRELGITNLKFPEIQFDVIDITLEYDDGFRHFMQGDMHITGDLEFTVGNMTYKAHHQSGDTFIIHTIESR